MKNHLEYGKPRSREIVNLTAMEMMNNVRVNYEHYINSIKLDDFTQYLEGRLHVYLCLGL